VPHQKSAFYHPHTPCVCGDANPPNAIAQYAEKIGALLTFVDTPYLGAISLQGEHQKTNAAVAIAAVNRLQSVFSVNQNQLARGQMTYHHIF
jgi:dihydrofolate synthase/folylpolyglutamate synthase